MLELRDISNALRLRFKVLRAHLCGRNIGEQLTKCQVKFRMRSNNAYSQLPKWELGLNSDSSLRILRLSPLPLLEGKLLLLFFCRTGSSAMADYAVLVHNDTAFWFSGIEYDLDCDVPICVSRRRLPKIIFPDLQGIK